MAITIDTLELEIIDNSDKVAASLSRLQGVLQGFKGAASTAGFGKIARQLEALSLAASKIPSMAGLNALAEGLSALSTLGKPQLGSFVTQLKKLPEVAASFEKVNMDKFAASIARVTAAVRPLANEMAKVSSGFSALPSKIQRIIQSNEKLASSSARSGKTFGAMGTGISSIQAKFGIYVMLAKRAVSVIDNWVSESNAYVENLNLFTVSMGKYANEALDYAKRVQSAMGIDMSEWIRNQGIFMQIGTGFGVVEEKAYKMSRGLTQIAYDMASYFNAPIETALEKVQSGFAGELEPLRRWGYALDVATLQQVAYQNGVRQSINTMTQAQKSQLRYTAIMQQSGNVMGDMGRTLGTPANAMRILGQQVTQLTRALGNMFIPILIKIVPYVQAVVIVLTEAAQAIANLFGFELPTIDYSGMGNGIGGVASGADDAATGLGDAAKQAKKLKDFTAGFDELNIVSPEPDAGGTGGGGAGSGGIGGSDLGLDIPDYNFLGDAKNKAKEIAKEMKKFFAGFKENPVIKKMGEAFKFVWEKGIKPLGAWIVANPKSFANFIVSVGVAIATYKLVATIQNISKALSGAAGLTGLLGKLAGVLTNLWVLTIAGAAAAIVWVATAIYDAKQAAIDADLAKRFGDISLSMEEVEAVAKKLTTSDLTIKLDLFYSENAKLEGIQESIKNNVAELNKAQWKIGIGMELTQQERADYATTIDAFVANTQDYVTQQHYVMTLAIDTLLEGTETGASLREFANKYMEQSQSELERLGMQLRDTVNKAFADGVVDAKEMQIITDFQNEMQEIVRQTAEMDLKASMTALIMDFDGTSLTFESFQEVMAKADENIQDQLKALEGVRDVSIKTALKQFEMTGNKQALDKANKEIEEQFRLQKLSVQYGTFDFGLQALTKAYGKELFEQTPELSINTTNVISQAFETAKRDPSGFNVQGFISEVGYSLTREYAKLEPEVRGSFKKVIECMKPTYEQMAAVKAECQKAGKAVPEEISTGLKDMSMLMAMTGDTAALYDLMGTAITGSPEQLQFLSAVEASGMDIPKRLADQINFNAFEVEDAVRLMSAGALAGAQEQAAANKAGLEDLAAQPVEVFKAVNGIKNGRSSVSEMIGGYLALGIGDGMEGKRDTVFRSISKWCNSLIKTVENLFGIHSPSTLFRDRVGVNLGLGIAEGITETTASIVGVAAQISKDVVGVFDKTQFKFNAPSFASGGYPTVGEMFIAREAGPEMVGSIGGRAAVANNDQIVQAVSRGVYDAVASVMAGQQERPIVVESNTYLDGKQIATSVERHQRERGATIMPGGAVFSV